MFSLSTPSTIAFRKLNDVKNKIKEKKALSDIDIIVLVEERASSLKNK